MYGAAATLEVSDRPDCGVAVRLRFPFREGPVPAPARGGDARLPDA